MNVLCHALILDWCVIYFVNEFARVYGSAYRLIAEYFDEGQERRTEVNSKDQMRNKQKNIKQCIKIHLVNRWNGLNNYIYYYMVVVVCTLSAAVTITE